MAGLSGPVLAEKVGGARQDGGEEREGRQETVLLSNRAT